MNLRYVYERDYDVIVCGLGSADFPAAVQCARLGLKTAALDKYHMPGGVLTVLGNNSIDQFNNPFLNGGDLVIRGICGHSIGLCPTRGRCGSGKDDSAGGRGHCTGVMNHFNTQRETRTPHEPMRHPRSFSDQTIASRSAETG